MDRLTPMAFVSLLLLLVWIAALGTALAHRPQAWGIAAMSAKAEHFLAFVGIAGALVCHRRCTDRANLKLVCRRPFRPDKKLAC